MMTTLKKFLASPYFPPVFLLWAAVLAYGVTIPWLGMYSDDWAFLYVYDMTGASGLADFIAWSRPFGAWLHALIIAPIGKQIAPYHIFLLLVRWLDALLFYGLLRFIFPEIKRPALWAATILLVYPAFKQQPLPIEYLAHFIVLGLFLLSLWCMLKAGAAKCPWGWRILGYVLAFNLFLIEYFAGLEMLRPVLLWIVLRRSQPDRRKLLKQVALEWLPYLGIAIFYGLWRVVLHPFGGYTPVLLDTLRSAPLAGVWMLLQSMARDGFTVLISAWVQVFSLPTGTRLLMLYAALVGGAFLSLGFFSFLWGKQDTPKSDPSFKQAGAYVALGIYAVLISGVPVWVPQNAVELTFPWDRSTLPFMFGVSLVSAGLIALLRQRTIQAVIVTLLASLSIGLHMQNANAYRKERQIVQDFFWQLTWRMPGLEPGTLISLEEPPFSYHVDKFLNPALNWSYNPQARGPRAAYNFYDFYKMAEQYPQLPPAETLAIHRSYGNISFDGSSDKVILAIYNPPGCFYILTPHEEGVYFLSERAGAALALTNLKVIDPAPETPARPLAMLGDEPAHGWCYYFEQADLARQQENWEEVARLGDEATQKGLSPYYAGEWLVFLEGYAHQGNVERARQVSLEAAKMVFLKPALCTRLKQIEGLLPEAEAIRHEIACP